MNNERHDEFDALKLEVARLQSVVSRLTASLDNLATNRPAIKPTTHLGTGAKVAPGVTLWSNEHAQIRIGSNTNIFRNAEINGPVTIGDGCLLNRDAYVRANTTIGDRVFVGPFARFITDGHEIAGPGKRAGKPTFEPIVIGDGSWIGAGSTILGGVTVGPGSIVAAGSVVSRDVPSNTLVGGVPAKFIRSLLPNPSASSAKVQHQPLLKSGVKISQERGIAQYHQSINEKLSLDVLVDNQESDVLVVSFHGALNRSQFTLPRFERLKTIQETNYSGIYFADPCLRINPKLQLSWFAGSFELDLYPILAQWISESARALGSKHIIVSGSSGGGFAALQTAAMVPGSIAVPFNPQTNISQYVLPDGNIWPQKFFLDQVMPELAPDNPALVGSGFDWTVSLDDRLAPTRRYARTNHARVLYSTSTGDFHHEQHFLPFERAMLDGGHSERLRVISYDGPPVHEPPTRERFLSAIEQAVRWSRGE